MTESTAAEETVYDTLCGICFTQVDPASNPRGRLNSCDHLFCAHCAKEWSRQTNICPSCKKRFTRIFITPVVGEEEIVKVRKKNYNAWDVGDGEEDEMMTQNLLSTLVCRVCNGRENPINMILCDRRQCTYIAHMDCLHLKERPLNFVCNECQGKECPAPRQRKMPMSAPASIANIVDHSAAPLTLPTLAPVLPEAEEDDYLYFLKPSEHTRQAQAALSKWKETHKEPLSLSSPSSPFRFSSECSTSSPSPVTPRAAREEAESGGWGWTTQKNEETTIEFAIESPTYVPPAYSAALSKARRAAAASRPATTEVGVKRVRDGVDAQTEEARQQALRRLQALEEEEKTLTDPVRRAALEERMAKEWAVDSVDVIRSQRFVRRNQLHLNDEGQLDMSAADHFAQADEDRLIWREAVEMCRPMVREKLQTRLYHIHQMKQRTLDIQSRREAIALAKLARLIASHRQSVAINAANSAKTIAVDVDDDC